MTSAAWAGCVREIVAMRGRVLARFSCDEDRVLIEKVAIISPHAGLARSGVAGAIGVASALEIAALLEFLAPDHAYRLRDRAREIVSPNGRRAFRVAFGATTGSNVRGDLQAKL